MLIPEQLSKNTTQNFRQEIKLFIFFGSFFTSLSKKSLSYVLRLKVVSYSINITPSFRC